MGSFGVTIGGFLFDFRMSVTPFWFVGFALFVFVTISLVPCLEEGIGEFPKPLFGMLRFSACNNDTRRNVNMHSSNSLSCIQYHVFIMDKNK